MAPKLSSAEDTEAFNICNAHDNKPDELLEILHSVQAGAGYLSEAALRTIAYALNISKAEIHGVVSFYHDFKRESGAKVTVKICCAEACQAVGAEQVIAEAERAFGTKLDDKASQVKLEAVYCLGNCALGPAAMIDDKLYGRVDKDKLKKIAKNHGSVALIVESTPKSAFDGRRRDLPR